MSKKLLSLLSIACFSMTTLFFFFFFENTANYDAQIDQAISQAEAEVQKQLNNATRRDVVPMWSDKVQLETAIRDLELKKILAANFKGTQSLNNPLIRNKLLEILNKSVIMQSDLAELQSLVTQEKARLNTQPSPTNIQVPAPLIP